MEEPRTYGTKCLTCEVPRNKYNYEGSVVLFHPGHGLIRIAFGTGDNLDQDDILEKDQNGNSIDDYMYISVFNELRGDYSSNENLEADEIDGGMLLFSHDTYKSGDIREMLEPSLEFMGWPDNIEEYVYISEGW